MPDETAITKTQPQALAPAPDYIKKGRDGLEDIGKQDVLIPRLALAQALSPQVTVGDPNLIEGLKVGDMFNSMTGTIYGREVRVQILRKDRPRAMEFYPQDDGGGVKDPDVPLNDPRLKWGEDGEKPQATLFRDYIAVLLPSREIIALSFKSSGIKVAKALNGLIVMRNRPIYAGAYTITTGVELKPKPHQVYLVQNAGWVSEEDAKLGEVQYEAVKDLDTTATIDRSVGTDVDDFNPAEYERERAGAAVGPDM